MRIYKRSNSIANHCLSSAKVYMKSAIIPKVRTAYPACSYTMQCVLFYIQLPLGPDTHVTCHPHSQFITIGLTFLWQWISHFAIFSSLPLPPLLPLTLSSRWWGEWRGIGEDVTRSRVSISKVLKLNCQYTLNTYKLGHFSRYVYAHVILRSDHIQRAPRRFVLSKDTAKNMKMKTRLL